MIVSGNNNILLESNMFHRNNTSRIYSYIKLNAKLLLTEHSSIFSADILLSMLFTLLFVNVDSEIETLIKNNPYNFLKITICPNWKTLLFDALMLQNVNCLYSCIVF